eukprot:8344054-Karenia_brevis.AAC.1
MERIVNAAGVPSAVVAKIPGIIDTCRECRAWATPRADPTPTVELTTKQNDVVEADILFYKKVFIWHMLDRADRWHAGQE